MNRQKTCQFHLKGESSNLDLLEMIGKRKTFKWEIYSCDLPSRKVPKNSPRKSTNPRSNTSSFISVFRYSCCLPTSYLPQPFSPRCLGGQLLRELRHGTAVTHRHHATAGPRLGLSGCDVITAKWVKLRNAGHPVILLMAEIPNNHLGWC